MKYKLHITYGGVKEQVCKAVESARDIGNIHVWADGRPSPYIAGVEHHSPGLVGCVPMINMCIKTSWDDDVMFWMHDDAEALPGVAKQFFDFIEDRGGIIKDQCSPYGVYWTNGDKLCAFNMDAVRQVGWWDTMFFQYMADIDYWHRLRLAGYPCLHSGINGVLHPEAKTVKDFDPIYMKKIQFIDGTKFDHHYYEFKWGGEQMKERFRTPFAEDKAEPRIQSIFRKHLEQRRADLQRMAEQRMGRYRGPPRGGLKA